MPYNQDAWRLVEAKVNERVAEASASASAALAGLFAGSADDLPSGKTATVGQLFIKTGSTNPGLYVCTASTSSASTWKAVSHAS